MSKTSIWSYQDNFDWRRDIDASDPFYEPLEQQRGDYTRRSVLNVFGLAEGGEQLPGANLKKSLTVLFGGHVGSGKSTELRLLAERFRHSYTVVPMELTKELDINSLRFSDVLIALARHLVELLRDRSLLSSMDETVLVKPVLEWFETRIVQQDKFTDLEGGIETKIKAAGGIPYLVQLLASITARIRTGASYRETLRNEIRDGFTRLLDSFNALIAHANARLQDQGAGPLLFMIDGSDKLSREDSSSFFKDDANQLRQIATNMIICAPISVLLEVGATAQQYLKRIRLPMVKICEKDGSIRQDAVKALVGLVARRMPLSYFDAPETASYLARMSGGHPRDLLRLVHACFARVDDAPITRAVAERAVRDVAAEYQRAVLMTDWPELAAIDASQGADTDATDERRRLLYDLVLLEYNNFWWRSHPLVRELDGYKRAVAAAAAGKPPSGAA